MRRLDVLLVEFFELYLNDAICYVRRYSNGRWEIYENNAWHLVNELITKSFEIQRDLYTDIRGNNIIYKEDH